MTAGLKGLIADAEKAGYAVKDMGDSGVVLSRPVKAKKAATRLEGLWIAGDGVAIRLDIDLAVATGIRSHKKMRKVLGI
jgi:hypothetical protein